MIMKKITGLTLATFLSLTMAGCEQPEMFKSQEEILKEESVLLMEEVQSQSLEETYSASFAKQLDDNNFKRLKKDTARNSLIESEMLEIGRDVMEREIEIYSLKDNKASFDHWVEDVFMYPEENEFLKHYKELGMFRNVTLSFDLDGEQTERVQAFGETGFLYHGLMHLKGENKETGKVEMAMLNLILHIDKDEEDNTYKIVKMGGPVAKTISKVKND